MQSVLKSRVLVAAPTKIVSRAPKLYVDSFWLLDG